MGEKGNVLETAQQLSTVLLQEAPEFWVAYQEHAAQRAAHAEAQGPGAGPTEVKVSTEARVSAVAPAGTDGEPASATGATVATSDTVPVEGA